MQVFGSLFGRNGNASGSARRTGYIFALVLFARTVGAHWGNLGDPLVALSRAHVGHELDLIQTRQGRRSCFGIQDLLFWDACALASVGAPIIWIAIQPGSLGARFVVQVHLICAQTRLPPTFAPFSLAGRCGAVGLVFDPWVRQEGLAAAGADYWGHQISPYENSYGNCQTAPQWAGNGTGLITFKPRSLSDFPPSLRAR
jgi:hypothetical protein